MPCPKDFSRVDANGRARAGSQRHIQTYVNERTEALNFAVAESLSRYHLDKKDIHWVSPLASDMYSEYQDAEFVSHGRALFQHNDPWHESTCHDAVNSSSLTSGGAPADRDERFPSSQIPRPQGHPYGW